MVTLALTRTNPNELRVTGSKGGLRRREVCLGSWPASVGPSAQTQFAQTHARVGEIVPDFETELAGQSQHGVVARLQISVPCRR